jgi:outer membrane protein OmpA-like peptidoglycan-associated protein
VPFSFSPGASYTPAPPQAAQPQAPAAPKPTKLASNTPPPATTSPSNQSPGAGFSRRSQIIFAANAGDPAPNALDAIRMLGGDLNAALNGGAQKIQLQAYGGARSDKSSDARRLSLKRALAIRNILIEAGVPSGKIDVRAMGGADDGPLDRVDVYVRS